MILPCIDLMDGKCVQLVEGKPWSAKVTIDDAVGEAIQRQEAQYFGDTLGPRRSRNAGILTVTTLRR